MNKKLVASLAASVLLLFSASASADSVLHIWSCQLNDGKTVQDAVDASSTWLKAAKTVEGGDDLAVFIDVGIAANFGDGHFNFVLVIPDEKTWGAWYGAPDPDGVGEEANAAWSEVAACSSSSLWNSIEIK